MHAYNRILLRNKNEWTTDEHTILDKSQGHDAKWDQAVSRSYI